MKTLALSSLLLLSVACEAPMAPDATMFVDVGQEALLEAPVVAGRTLTAKVAMQAETFSIGVTVLSGAHSGDACVTVDGPAAGHYVKLRDKATQEVVDYALLAPGEKTCVKSELTGDLDVDIRKATTAPWIGTIKVELK